MNIKARFFHLIAIAVTLATASNSLAQTYTITKIPQPAGTSGYGAANMNNLGQVVGNTKVKNGRFDASGPAFVWENGTFVNLPPLPGDPAAGANAISDSGLVVGYSPRQLGPPPRVPERAVWWQKSGAGYVVGNWNAFLPAGSPLRLLWAVGVSHDGKYVVFENLNSETGQEQAVVAEVAFDAASRPSGFTGLWLIDSLNGSVTSDGFVSVGIDISHDGNGIVRVVGYANTQTSAQAFLWEKHVVSGAVGMIDLDPSGSTSSSGAGVNGQGEVTGNIYVSGVYQAHFWDAAGARQSIGTLGGTRAVAFSINGPGYVVGWSNRSGKNAAAHAFLWHSSTGMRDLNALKSPADTSGLELTSASKINNAGQILAIGSSKTLGNVAVLLHPQ